MTITNILKNNYAEGVFHTHVSMHNPRGKFNINRHDMEKLWDLYQKEIDEGKKYGLAEKPSHYLPVLGDIDIKIKITENKDEKEYTREGFPLYEIENALSVIEIYQSVLRKIVDDCNDDQLLCVLLEKPPYIIEKNGIKYKKHGFHLHFPNCFLSKIDQEIHLIPRVQEAVKELQLFDYLGYSDSSKVIDNSCCNVSWLLYGSSKELSMDSYKISKIYDSECNELSLEDAFAEYSIYNEKEERINIKGNVSKYLARILSITPYGREIHELRHGIPSPVKEKIKNLQVKEKKTYKSLKVSEAINKAREFVKMLAPFRADDFIEWMKIGWILYNISDGNEDGLDLWCEFSSQNEKYDEAVCIHKWERMVKKDIGMGTLKFFAKKDNFEAYKEFCEKETEHYVEESLIGSHSDIAKILYAEYGTEFKCASYTQKIWFQYRNHVWEQIEDGIFLRKKISSDIVNRFNKLGQKCFEDLASEEDKAHANLHSERIKKVQKMVLNLKNSSFKTSIMKEAMEEFYDRKFKQKLDTNPYLIAFKNGVYDLAQNIFRQGIPEDYLSKKLPIIYNQGLDMNSSSVQNVLKFLEQVFPDKSVRQYFLDITSDIFVGGNRQKIVPVWSGDGDNGKSVTQTIFEKMLGEFAIKLNTTVVTGKKVSSGSANADLARAGGGVRWVVMEEPGGDEEINDGILNNLSGNDSFYARDLFEKGKDGREINPMFILTLICNKFPKLRYNLEATWNRIRVIPFESVFVRSNDPNPAPETYEEQLREKRFHMDPNFAEKIPGMLEAFAWYLLEHRKNIKVRITPPKVLAATEAHKKKNDIFRQFSEECVIEDKNETLTLIELYAQFKDWHKDSVPYHTLPIKSDVETYFTSYWGEPSRGKKWKGYRLRNEKDDIEDGNIVFLDENDLVEYNSQDESKQIDNDSSKNNLPNF